MQFGNMPMIAAFIEFLDGNPVCGKPGKAKDTLQHAGGCKVGLGHSLPGDLDFAKWGPPDLSKP